DFSCITDNCATECKDLPFAGPGATGSGVGGGVPDLPGGDIYAARSCNGCHGDQGQGNQGPNITSSKTAGIGAWTTQELEAAIRDGKLKDGTDLCSSMPRWTVKQLSDADLASIIGFMQALPAIDVPSPGSLCAGGGTGGSAASGGPPMLDISKECFTCLDANCKDIANVLHCVTGQ
ncbi:MAG: c-type cytochrome, partial [Byssovorax sp.]